MKAFFAALQFLTVLRVPLRFQGAGVDLERCAPFFPLVGLLVGALAALFDFLVSQILPSAIASTLTVLILVKLTGGLHMDGLADTADGFFSARDRETILAIMRDSRIGTMGVMAIVFVILIKVGALTTLELPRRTALILLAPVAGQDGHQGADGSECRRQRLVACHQLTPACGRCHTYSGSGGLQTEQRPQPSKLPPTIPRHATDAASSNSRRSLPSGCVSISCTSTLLVLNTR